MDDIQFQKLMEVGQGHATLLVVIEGRLEVLSRDVTSLRESYESIDTRLHAHDIQLVRHDTRIGSLETRADTIAATLTSAGRMLDDVNSRLLHPDPKKHLSEGELDDYREERTSKAVREAEHEKAAFASRWQIRVAVFGIIASPLITALVVHFFR